MDTVQVRVHFYSYCKDLTGTAQAAESVAPGCRLQDLLEMLFRRFPRLGAMRLSLLTAVGVDYQSGEYVLQDGDEVSLFPPVQGG
jgi:molybdopterin converting factor small subunit